jgi:hypothetical protein
MKIKLLSLLAVLALLTGCVAMPPDLKITVVQPSTAPVVVAEPALPALPDLGVRGTVSREGIIDVNGDGVQTWNGGVLSAYSDQGDTVTFSATGSTGDLYAGDTIVFEGSSADAYETTLVVTNPTSSDKTITFPNTTGTVALNPLGESIEFEGLTADDYEMTLTVVDPTTPDKTLTLPNETGAVMVSSLATNGTDLANSVTGASNGLVFEGSGVDNYETTVSATNSTADRSVVLPDAGGTVMLSSLATNGADAANAVTGGSNALIFEGSGVDAYEMTISATNPTAARTLTLPDATGTVALTSQGVDMTLTADSTGGNALAKTEYSGLPRIAQVGLGEMADGTTNTVLTDIGDSETPATKWTAIDGDTTMSNDSSIYRQGSASLKMVVASTAAAGDGTTNTLTSGDQNWTDDEGFGFWFYTTKALDAGDLTLRIADATAAGGYTAVNVPAATANSWQWLEIDVTLGNNNLKDVVTALSFNLSAAGEAKALAGTFNVYFDFIVKWDVAEEETLANGILTDGVLSVVAIDMTNGAATTTNLVEYTNYFVHYQTGNDAIVPITDLADTDKIGLALVAY